MVLIAVKNFKDQDSLGVYEFPTGSSILDLKAEIEVTEGVPIGHQRLVRRARAKQELKNNKNLDSLISDGSSKAIIYLVKPRIFCRFERQSTDTPIPILDHERPQEEVDVDLDEPIRTFSLWFRLWLYHSGVLIPDPYVANISVLSPDGQPTVTISDIDKSFSYYGVCNGDTIYLAYVPGKTRGDDTQSEWYKVADSTFGSFHATGLHGLSDSTDTIVRAKYDWNGEIMHPKLKGLSLKRTALFTVFGTSKDRNSPGWLYGSPISSSRYITGRVGYFPEIFVSPVDETVEQHLDVNSTEILDIPPLPHFHFPPARGMSFRMPIGDKGHSFLKLTANYECISSPVDPTHVTISLSCATHDIRRVSAVSVFITIPESVLLDVQVCENEAHQKEIRTDKETTETQSKGKYFDGINIGTYGTTVGLQGGVSRSYSLSDTEKGQKVSRRKVTAEIDKEDTIFWNLKAPTSKLDEDGLNGEESITLILKKKPVQFKYKCRVTHARDGIEKTTQRMTEDRSWLKIF